MNLKHIPEFYPDDLSECMGILAKISYDTHGFPIMSLYYNYDTEFWSVMFRNPSRFDNPKIEAAGPLGAVWQMFDYLKSL